jgi:hypothetical protein
MNHFIIDIGSVVGFIVEKRYSYTVLTNTGLCTGIEVFIVVIIVFMLRRMTYSAEL